MIKIISTRNYAAGEAKVLVSGPAGIGKTRLCATAPDSIIISAEAGLLLLADVDISVIEVSSVDDVRNVLNWAKSSTEAKEFKTICLDSITEIAEVCLTQYKKDFKDPRAAYGQLQDDVPELIREFRDLKDKNVYFSAKQSRIEEAEGSVVKFKAAMPGKYLLANLPYFFDIVLTMRLGKLEDGTIYRYLQTYSDFQYDCKDRSDRLAKVEKPDLSYIFKKLEQPRKEEDKGEDKDKDQDESKKENE